VVLRHVVPALLAAAGLGVAVAGSRERLADGASKLVGKKTFTSGERFKPLRMNADPSLRFGGVRLPPPEFIAPSRYRPMMSRLVQVFGTSTINEYPAPYRYADAWKVTDIAMRAAVDTSPIQRPYYQMLRRRFEAINTANMANWRKTYALLMTVIQPAFAADLFWHWYRPTSNTKKERFDAIASYVGLFLVTPETATAARTIDPHDPMSSLLPGWPPYVDASTPLRRGDLSVREMRRCVYDLYEYQRTWPTYHPEYGGGSGTNKLIAHAGERMQHLKDVYPLSDPDAWVIQGNLKAVDELVWLDNARVQGQITVDLDEGEAYAALALRTVATVVAAVAPLVGPQIAAALQTATDALSTLASLVANGDVSSAEIQAMAGAGVATILENAGIRLGLSEELAAIRRQL